MSPLSIASRLMLLSGVVLIVLLGLAAWFLRDQVFQTFQDPGQPFQTYSPPPGADYAENDAWFVRQQVMEDTATAVFFVHSTTYSGGANWNAELDKDIANREVEDLVLPNYAAPFMENSALFAPRYRQAALYTFMNNREDGVQARLFAYRDVERAFEQFLVDIGEESSFVLAGVGQGGLHVLGILMNQIAQDEAIANRLAIAYVIETPLPLDLFEGPLAGLPACETPMDVRCVFAYSTAHAEEERRIRIMTERLMSWAPDGSLDFVEGRGLLCTNPILAARSADYAPARLHRGGVDAEGFALDARPATLPAQLGAQCDGGILLVDEPRSRSLRRPRRLAEDFREPPFNLFYEDLRVDIARRVATANAILEEQRRWAPPLGDPEAVEEAPVVPIPDRRRF